VCRPRGVESLADLRADAALNPQKNAGEQAGLWFRKESLNCAMERIPNPIQAGQERIGLADLQSFGRPRAEQGESTLPGKVVSIRESLVLGWCAEVSEGADPVAVGPRQVALGLDQDHAVDLSRAVLPGLDGLGSHAQADIAVAHVRRTDDHAGKLYRAREIIKPAYVVFIEAGLCRVSTPAAEAYCEEDHK
jgi:hypothetical protein